MAKRKVESLVKFGTPPPRQHRAPYDWTAIAEQLRENPGEWACVFENDRTTYATAIRNNGIKALRPDRGFEVRTANNVREPTPRKCDLWMRYVPEKDTYKEDD